MTPNVPDILLILKEAVEKDGLKFEMVDKYSNCLAEVSNGEKSCLVGNHKVGLYPINLKNPSMLVSDKAWCNLFLKQKGYKIPKGDYFFVREMNRELRGDGKERQDGHRYAKKLGYPVFVKPAGGSLGILADVIHSEAELKEHFDKISESDYIALIQEVVKQPEYRIFVVDGEVEYTYRKTYPKIVGDGKRTIKNLVKGFNSKIFRERARIDISSAPFGSLLSESGNEVDSILENGESIKIMNKANITTGGCIEDYTEEVSDETRKWAKELVETLNLRVCGIDVFASDSINNPDGFTIIEVNQCPSVKGIYDMGKKEKALGIFRKVFSRYFQDNG